MRIEVSITDLSFSRVEILSKKFRPRYPMETFHLDLNLKRG
jgi:hypothetical protein